MAWTAGLAAILVLSSACSRAAPSSEGPRPAASPIGPSSVAGEASSPPIDPPAGGGGLTLAPLPAEGKPCPAPRADAGAAGTLTCFTFDSAASAFRWILSGAPTVVAVGEAHAQKGTETTASATKRFTEELLPVLAGKASDLLVEAWAGNAKCRTEVAAVASAQAPVKQAQAETNGSEYLALGNKAKALGVTPWLLEPTCEDYAELADAGADVVGASLALIKRLTQADVVKRVRRNEAASNGKLVVTYGGAMHNDLFPDEALRAYTFGPELLRSTGGRYVELDLIVPSYVKDTDSWKKLPWYDAWKRSPGSKDTVTLYRLGEASFVLLFAETGPKPG